ncbi:alpha/beta hydrolase [Acidisarcina polymorpha]|uniref:alpha/beta hydrolase n=1 Tax=Acidisarcina polymorpha TaxID=2211140 RepID=UPI001F4461E0|nr:alpha/beta hydrolase [Acidisarcina polymorpha]
MQPLPQGLWENEFTLRSIREARMYEPGNWISRASPTPLMLIVAREDRLTVTDLALEAYERALESKRLVLLAGGHFAPYVEQFSAASAAATAWFDEHLMASDRNALLERAG